MKNTAFARPLLTAIVLSLFGTAAPASERGDWKEALRLDNVPIYERFIRSHPDSSHISEARQHLETSRRRAEAAAWESLRNTSNKLQLNEFIKQYPDGLFFAAAQARLVAVDYEVAAASKTLAAYKTFLSEHPQSAQAVQAREAIARLTAQADEAAFTLAQKTNRYFDLQAYAQGFPSGAHADDVAATIAKYSWTKIGKPTLVPWDNLVATLLDAVALQKKLQEANSFGGMMATMPLKGSIIQPIDRIVFVARDTAVPFIKDSIVEPTSFQVDGGSEYLKLSTPGPNDHIRSVWPLILVSVGSTISVGPGEDTSRSEARATVVGAAGPAGSSFSMAKDPMAVTGQVNLFGIPCRGGSLRVVEKGLELQPGTVVMLKK
jgi:hypothetical protein